MSTHRTPTIKRQSLENRLSHWLVALATLALIVSGMLQMPMAQRYKIVQVPGLAWTADFHFTLSLHYYAAALLLFAVAYHIAYALATRRFAILPQIGRASCRERV